MYWGFGSVIFLYFIHPITVRCFDQLRDDVALIACPILLIIFIIDIIHATIKAMDVRKFMDKIQKAYSMATNIKDDLKNGVKSNTKLGINYIGLKYENVKGKIDSWRKDTYSQLKNMLPTSDEKKSKSEKKDLPNHHLKSYPNLLNYAKDQLKKIDDIIDEFKKDSEDK